MLVEASSFPPRIQIQIFEANTKLGLTQNCPRSPSTLCPSKSIGPPVNPFPSFPSLPPFGPRASWKLPAPTRLTLGTCRDDPYRLKPFAPALDNKTQTTCASCKVNKLSQSAQPSFTSSIRPTVCWNPNSFSSESIIHYTTLHTDTIDTRFDCHPTSGDVHLWPGCAAHTCIIASSIHYPLFLGRPSSSSQTTTCLLSSGRSPLRSGVGTTMETSP